MLTSKQTRRWTQRVAVLTLTTIVSGCASGVSGSLEALCSALEPRVQAHATALAGEGSDAVVNTGADLIAGFDAGCSV